MIAKESRSIEWITQVAKENNAKDIGLVEKTIRAFSLLESLARSGCPFIFKGGSCLMLHFNTSRRLSIDIGTIFTTRLTETGLQAEKPALTPKDMAVFTTRESQQ